MLSNLYDFDPQTDAVPFEKLEDIDQYMLRLTAALAADVTQWYDEFAFHRIYHRVNHYCVAELSAFYFDVIKDRLYISAPKSQARRAAQTAIWRIGEAMARLLAPIMSFTTEEVWGYLPKVRDRAESVHLALFPSAANLLGEGTVIDDPQQKQDWTALLAIRDEVLKALDTARNEKLIGKPLEAQVIISAADPAYALLSRYHGAAAVFIYRVGGDVEAGRRQWHGGGTRRGEESGRRQVRALLELLGSRGRGQGISYWWQ